MDSKAHWEAVYRTRRADEVSWYQAEASTSLRWIRETVADPDAPIIDVGGGASSLARDLARSGFRDITVLDIAGSALAASRSAAGDAADGVKWTEADLLEATLPAAHFACWHDRAVFHFLTDADQRDRYLAQLRHALPRGGLALIATFADDGPTRCSGLPTMRYSPQELAEVVGVDFHVVRSGREVHHTPSGTEQAFSYVMLRRDNSAET